MSENLETAFREAFALAIPGSVGKTAFENQGVFDPASLEKWYIFNYFPNQPDVASLGRTGLDEITGFVQIDINISKGKGKKGLADDVDALRESFTAGTRVRHVDSGTVAVVQSCGRSGMGRLVDAFHRFSVTIFFRAHVSRDANLTVEDVIDGGSPDSTYQSEIFGGEP